MLGKISISPIGTCRISTPLKRGAVRFPIKLDYQRDHVLMHEDFEGFIKLGVEFSDAVIVAGDNKKLEGLFKKIKEKKIETIESENYTESYYNLYNELVG